MPLWTYTRDDTNVNLFRGRYTNAVFGDDYVLPDLTLSSPDGNGGGTLRFKEKEFVLAKDIEYTFRVDVMDYKNIVIDTDIVVIKVPVPPPVEEPEDPPVEEQPPIEEPEDPPIEEPPGEPLVDEPPNATRITGLTYVEGEGLYFNALHLLNSKATYYNFMLDGLTHAQKAYNAPVPQAISVKASDLTVIDGVAFWPLTGIDVTRDHVFSVTANSTSGIANDFGQQEILYHAGDTISRKKGVNPTWRYLVDEEAYAGGFVKVTYGIVSEQLNWTLPIDYDTGLYDTVASVWLKGSYDQLTIGKSELYSWDVMDSEGVAYSIEILQMDGEFALPQNDSRITGLKYVHGEGLYFDALHLENPTDTKYYSVYIDGKRFGTSFVGLSQVTVNGSTAFLPIPVENVDPDRDHVFTVAGQKATAFGGSTGEFGQQEVVYYAGELISERRGDDPAYEYLVDEEAYQGGFVKVMYSANNGAEAHWTEPLTFNTSKNAIIQFKGTNYTLPLLGSVSKAFSRVNSDGVLIHHELMNMNAIEATDLDRMRITGFNILPGTGFEFDALHLTNPEVTHYHAYINGNYSGTKALSELVVEGNKVRWVYAADVNMWIEDEVFGVMASVGISGTRFGLAEAVFHSDLL